MLIKLVKDQTDADKIKHTEKNCIFKAVKMGQFVSLDLYQTCNYIRGQTQHAWDFFFLPYHSITLGQYILFQRIPLKLQPSYFKCINICSLLQGKSIETSVQQFHSVPLFFFSVFFFILSTHSALLQITKSFTYTMLAHLML